MLISDESSSESEISELPELEEIYCSKDFEGKPYLTPDAKEEDDGHDDAPKCTACFLNDNQSHTCEVWKWKGRRKHPQPVSTPHTFYKLQ